DGTVSQRRHIRRLGVADRFAASAYASNQATIVTAAVAHASSEVRIHAVTAPPDYRIRDGAHALAAPQPPTAEVLGAALEEQDSAEVLGAALEEQHTAEVRRTALADRRIPTPVGPAARVRRPDGLTSGITALAGFTTAAVHRTEGADAFAHHA